MTTAHYDFLRRLEDPNDVRSSSTNDTEDVEYKTRLDRAVSPSLASALGLHSSSSNGPSSYSARSDDSETGKYRTRGLPSLGDSASSSAGRRSQSDSPTLATLADHSEAVNNVGESDDEDISFYGSDELDEPTPPASAEDTTIDKVLRQRLLDDNFPEVVGLYQILIKIGEGTYSSVFKAKATSPKPIAQEVHNSWVLAASTSSPPAIPERSAISTEFIALKRIYPTSEPNKILTEAKLLNKLGGAENVVPLTGGLRYEDKITLIMPYMENHSARIYMTALDLLQIKHYLRGMFRALAHLHRHHIIHRDIKPSNFLWNSDTLEFFLLDFGLAQNQVELEEHNREAIYDLKRPLIDMSRKRKREAEPPEPKEAPAEAPAKRLKLSSPASKELQQLPPKPALRQMTPQQSRDQIAQRLLGIVSNSNSHSSGVQAVGPVVLQRLQRRDTKRPLAPRGGTRGFRAPEVLLRCTNQTSALDVWSAGVILLCLLSRRYPFFYSSDDMDSLCEIGAICGTEQLETAAKTLGKVLRMPQSAPRMEFRPLCEKLRLGNDEAPSLGDVPASAYALLERCLDLNPNTRITAEQALSHPFLAE